MAIRPVNYNTSARSNNISKILKNKFKNMQTFSDKYNIKYSIEIADEHTKLHIKQNNILIKLYTIN